MDPNAALQDARDALFAARNAPEGGEGDNIELSALRDLRDAFESLDEWLSSGGFLPRTWNPTEARMPFWPDEEDDPSGETCENRHEIDRDDEGDWIHVIRDDKGRRVAATLECPPADTFGLPAGEWDGVDG